MDLFDKFLIIVLIIILPTSIFFSARAYQNEIKELKSNADQEKIAKVNEAIDDIETQLDTTFTKVQEKKTVPIEISSVKFATTSGKLEVTGKAPGKNLNIMVSAIVTPIKTTEKSKTSSGSAKKVDDSVLGEKVEVIAVKTDGEGNFKFIKQVDLKKIDLIELRFDQGDSSATIQYDLVRNKRTL
ncbi:hypothetical protein GYA19_03140 [Candidatus Beckwithbacteria bacterium]|nr:hypothetical protein [Candidatus Beckwithbacteria bacterium]